MQFTKLTLLFASAVSATAGFDKREYAINPKCARDNCLRGLLNTRVPGSVVASSDCSTFIQTTSTQTVTIATSIVTYNFDACQTVVMVKRVAISQPTEAPKVVPRYASACSGSVRYKSACSCIYPSGLAPSVVQEQVAQTTITVSNDFTVNFQSTTGQRYWITSGNFIIAQADVPTSDAGKFYLSDGKLLNRGTGQSYCSRPSEQDIVPCSADTAPTTWEVDSSNRISAFSANTGDASQNRDTFYYATSPSMQTEPYMFLSQPGRDAPGGYELFASNTAVYSIEPICPS